MEGFSLEFPKDDSLYAGNILIYAHLWKVPRRAMALSMMGYAKK